MKYFIILGCIILTFTITGNLKENKQEIKKPTVIQADVMPGSYALLSL